VWHLYKYGFVETIKKIVNILLPSFLIILFNLKAGKLLFKSPLIGIFSVLPSSIFIYRASQPALAFFNAWIDKHKINNVGMDNVVDAEAVQIDE
tara:strand:- start:5887 stop:6168 length:282 start_codon:yes stop_codon:yes gene_type:complete